MSAKTGIAWTDATWNPVRGCSLVSAGCTNCYAMKQAHRFSGPGGAYEGLTKMTSHGPVWTGEARAVPPMLDEPLRWRKPRRIFVNSMSDLFHEDVPDGFIDRVFAVMAFGHQHTFQVLTKRPERMRSYVTAMARRDRIVSGAWPLGDGQSLTPQQYADRSHIGEPGSKVSVYSRWPFPNVWLGVSVEDQATADERIPLLLRTPAAVRFISYEPALGPVDLRSHLEGHCTLHDFEGGFCVQRDHPEVQRLHWVIVGGESGPKARPFNVAWARDIIAQCKAAGVACFVKQLGSNSRGVCAGWARAGEGARDDDMLDPGYCDAYEASEGGPCNSFDMGCICFSSRSVANPEEWPEDLRVQEFSR